MTENPHLVTSTLIDVQGEHKFFPSLQTFFTRKLRGIQTYFLPLLKLVSTVLCNVFIVMLQLQLKARITDAFATITEDMLENTWRETDYRLDVLCATKGAYTCINEACNAFLNTLRTGNFLLKIVHRSLIRSEVPFTI
jgi:hypothetical protein